MAEQRRRVIAAACDGACSGNPGPGGWGGLLRFEDGAMRELGGSEAATTNNRMELSAALAVYEALASLPRHPDLVIRTDSRYLIDGLQKWLPGWKRKGWRTASGGPVLNRDLWERLEQARLKDVPLVHVRGHNGDPDNERCDAIAVAFSRGQRPALACEGSAPPAGTGSTAAAPAAASALSAASGVSSTRHGRSADATSPAPAPAPASSDRSSQRLHSDAGIAAAADDPSPASAPTLDADLAPASLQQLLSRLELAERLARGGFALSLLELAQLVEMPVRSLEGRREAWTWRDWSVLPAGEGRWRLERDAGGLGARE